MTVKAIDRAKAHFKRLTDEPKAIRVPEWDAEDGEFTLYSTPLTLQERAKLARYASNKHEMGAELLIMKAHDKQGKPIFTREDKIDLMRSVDADVIGKIIQVIVGGDDNVLVEEAEKN